MCERCIYATAGGTTSLLSRCPGCQREIRARKAEATPLTTAPKVYTTFDNPKFKGAYDVYEGDIASPDAALYRGTGMSIQITANFPGATIVHRATPPATKDALTAHDAA